MSSQRIVDLEHATIRPLGQDPDHCPHCRFVYETRALQATCAHPANERNRVDVTPIGSPRKVYLTSCALCGKRMDA